MKLLTMSMTITTRHMLNDYLRVTEVLYPFSGLDKVPEHILKAAAERGSLVHAFCDAHISGIGVPEINESLKGYYDSFLLWAEDKHFLEKPDRFYDDVTGVTGECDAIYKEENELVLVDFKTSTKEGKTWPLQGAAYVNMALHVGYDIHKIQFIKLCKQGKFPKVFYYDYQKYLPIWHMCLQVYKEFFLNIETNYESLV